MATGGNSGKDVETLTGFFDDLVLSEDPENCSADKLFFVHQMVGKEQFTLVFGLEGFAVPLDIIKVAKSAVGCLKHCLFLSKLYEGYYLQCFAKVLQLEVKPLSDSQKVVCWTRYGCALDDVEKLEIVKAGFEVLLSYIQTKAAHQVLFGESF